VKTLESILGSPTAFLNDLFENLNKDKINISECELDHLCYRVETVERYQQLKKEITSIATLLTESPINKRPIATFELDEPIKYQSRQIHLLELPSPKENSFYKEGFEHIEFVVKQSLPDWINLHQNINFDTKGMTKKINPEIRISYGAYSVKFHNFNLAYVIKYLD